MSSPSKMNRLAFTVNQAFTLQKISHLVYEAMLEVAAEDVGLMSLILRELPGDPAKMIVHLGHEDGRCTSLILGGVIA